MILHDQAPQRATYINRRGLQHERARDIRQAEAEMLIAVKQEIAQYEQMLPRAVAANAEQDATYMRARLMELRQWEHEHAHDH